MSVEFKDFKKALKSMKKDIEKAEPLILLAWSQQFAKDNKEDNVPFKDGYLGDSAIKTPILFQKQGTVIWKTPYARRRYYENYLNKDKTKWDIKTFNQNKETYAKQFAKRYDNNLYK